MKNAFLFIAALFMLATSCTNTETDPAINATLVSFTIDAPELQTRVTDGNGESTNRLQYAFYDAQGNHLPALNGIVEGFVGSTTIQIALVEGCSYSALFWADNTAAPYSVDFGNKKMEIATTTFDGNADKYDAFYKYETNIDPVEKTRKVVLTRPFAQLNIATADTAKAASAGFSAVATEVTVTAHSTLNLATGAVADNDYKTFTYAFAALPTDPAEAKVSGMSYDMLAMNYVLVNERELIDVTMKVSEDAQGTNPIERTYSNVPMQRNYRTYIVGNLLTTENEFNAMISPDWLKDYIYDTNIIVDKIDVEDDKTGDDTEVTLKTKEDWTAKVVFEATRSTEAWCTVEPTNGVAGETILTISTEPNDTGKDRTATVIIKSGESTQEITVKQLAIVTSDEEEENPVPNNQIWYTSTDGNIVSPNKTDVFGATIVSNTYEDGKGVITFDGDVTVVGKDAFKAASTTLETIQLPNSVTEIGKSAFGYCNALTNITLPNSLIKIENDTFAGCKALTNITLPDSLIEIGKDAFKSSGLTSITIPESVTTVGDAAFLYCDSLSAFYGKGATEDNRCLVIDGVIKAFASANYESDTYTIPYGATTVGDNAFSNLTILTEIVIPESVTTIDRYAFASSNGLLTVTLPKSITSIGQSAFQRCQNLATVYCKSTTPSTLSSNVFFSNAEDRKIYVPAESVEAYKEAWSDYADYIFAEGAEDEDDENDDEEYVDKVGDPDFQAAIGNKKFVTLQEALNVVEDNQTITLLNRVNLDKMTDILELYRAVNFTLDLDGYRIHSDGNPNYQISREANGMIDINTSKSTDVKNATIIIKDGFLTYNGSRPMIGIAGSTEAQTIVDLENVKISGAVGPDNNISCAVRITHSNVTVNLKNGTKISNDREVASSQVNVMHYPLVEVCCGTLNIYDGVEFSYNYVEHANNLSPRQMVVISTTAGHTNTAVVNVYGGYGRVAGSCFTMGHNGGLFNIYGGEWIANTDGSMPKPSLNSGYAVQDPAVVALDGPYGYTSQNIANIYGGILRGRFHCGWSRGSGDPAQLNISGGNFNADPTEYVVEGHTATQNSQGYWVVE